MLLIRDGPFQGWDGSLPTLDSQGFGLPIVKAADAPVDRGEARAVVFGLVGEVNPEKRH
jgi:hypothetical protein